MRDIANVAFVIAFMIIIFSQLTSVGITNYGVKKMLPRLVIAAILVNASYLICLLAVDISNILGYSLKAVFDNLQNFTKPSYTSADASGNGWGIATMIAGLVAGGITLAFAISIPVLLAALLALMLIVLILFGRTALIILLIVVSPLAFVAYLLPNTEQWFKKWYKMFSSLLLVFPIIAVVVGASGLAAGILKEVAGTDKILQVIAIGVATIPLFVVPSLLKSALGSAGAIGAKLNGLSSKLNGKVKSQGSKTMEGSRIGQYKKFRAGEGAKRTAKIQSGTYEGRGGNFNPRNLASSLNSRINQSSRSGKFGDRATAQGAALEDAEDAELKKNAASRLDYYDQPNGNPLSQDQMMQIATGQDLTDEHGAHLASASSFDTHTRKAAIEKAAKIATVSQAQQLTNASSARNAAGENLMSAGERKTLSAAMAGSSAVAKAPWLGGRNLGDIDQGTATTDGSALRAINEGKVSADSLAHSDATGIETLLRVARGTSPDAVRAKAQLKAAHADYLTQPLLHTGVASGSAYAANLATIATF
jgi:hypothetical protein